MHAPEVRLFADKCPELHYDPELVDWKILLVKSEEIFNQTCLDALQHRCPSKASIMTHCQKALRSTHNADMEEDAFLGVNQREFSMLFLDRMLSRHPASDHQSPKDKLQNVLQMRLFDKLTRTAAMSAVFLTLLLVFISCSLNSLWTNDSKVNSTSTPLLQFLMIIFPLFTLFRTKFTSAAFSEQDEERVEKETAEKLEKAVSEAETVVSTCVRTLPPLLL